MTYKATAVAWNKETGKVDLPVEYIARDYMEAVRWANCNKDYIRNVKIEELK